MTLCLCTPDESLFSTHHLPLSDALALLAHAIHLVLRRAPTTPSDPTPTSAHIVLKARIDEIVRDVQERPIVGVSTDT